MCTMKEKNDLKIGIMGVGMVGGTLRRYLEEIRKFQRGKNLFLYDTDPRKGNDDDINLADIIFVSVPTPEGSDGSANLSILEDAFKKIAENKIVVIKSTVPPGTSEFLNDKYPKHKVLFNPEFLTEANAWTNMLNPERQLVGWTKNNQVAAAIVLSILPQAPLMSPSPDLNLTATEAEIIKYAANVFLTRKVTFANAIFDLASHHKADYKNIKLGIASDPRIGSSHLDVDYHGYRGYGGYCFTKDTSALISHLDKSGLREAANLFKQDRAYNETLLKKQGLTPEDVSLHDAEWVKKKIKQ